MVNSNENTTVEEAQVVDLILVDVGVDFLEVEDMGQDVIMVIQAVLD